MKKGFTLAEVLLTLAIIGVVAALTIPAVITKVTQDQYVVGLKKAYNTLKAVEREAVQEHGEMTNWTWAGDLTDFDNYFKTHFDILKDCGKGTDDGCFSGTYLQVKGSTTYSNVSANTTAYAKIITSDGISFAYTTETTGVRKGYFLVDVNGKKAPNRMGRDLFWFNVLPSYGGIKPHGSITAQNVKVTTSEVDTNCVATGEWCTTKVLAEGAMNY